MARNIISDKSKLGGVPFLEGTRIRVSDIAVKYEDLGYTLEEIAEAYKQLETEDIEKALSYFYTNRNLDSRVSEGETA